MQRTVVGWGVSVRITWNPLRSRRQATPVARSPRSFYHDQHGKKHLLDRLRLPQGGGRHRDAWQQGPDRRRRLPGQSQGLRPVGWLSRTRNRAGSPHSLKLPRLRGQEPGQALRSQEGIPGDPQQPGGQLRPVAGLRQGAAQGREARHRHHGGAAGEKAGLVSGGGLDGAANGPRLPQPPPDLPAPGHGPAGPGAAGPACRAPGRAGRRRPSGSGPGRPPGRTGPPPPAPPPPPGRGGCGWWWSPRSGAPGPGAPRPAGAGRVLLPPAPHQRDKPSIWQGHGLKQRAHGHTSHRNIGQSPFRRGRWGNGTPGSPGRGRRGPGP